MEIPYKLLSEAALRGIVEEFVLREGTEYGRRDYSLEEKRGAVVEQLRKGQAKIMFDSEAGSCDIVPVSALLPVDKSPN